jgi:hypothetical protein
MQLGLTSLPRPIEVQYLQNLQWLQTERSWEIKKVGGTQYVYTESKEKLEAIHRELGLQDEWFDN